MTEAPVSAAPDHTALPPRRRKVPVSLVFGELLLTVGVLFLLFAFYESYWTNIASGKKQQAIAEQLDQQWEEQWSNPRQKLTPELGAAFARMYIPTFGSDFSFAVVHGTDEEALLAGPGHYVDTQLPGEHGNFAIAGHRVGKGAPFNDLGNVNSCDAVVIETQNAWNVYRVLPLSGEAEQRRQEAAACLSAEQTERVTTGDYATVQGRYITLPTDVATISPLPGVEASAAADGLESLITLTTCHPQFSNAERMIVHGMLVESFAKDGVTRPSALEET